MPQYQENISTGSLSAEDIKIICYKTLEELGWKISAAIENNIVAKTPQTWKRYANEIILTWEDGHLSVTSKMTHGELMDVFGRTKKDVAEWKEAFEDLRKQYQPGAENIITEKIGEQEAATIKNAEEELQLTMETDRVMNIYSGNNHLTMALIGINVLVFITMVVSGVNIFSPTADDIIQWGGNLGQLTTRGDWWRMISSVFIHIGILHLLFNMYGLFFIGRFLEPMLGKLLYLAAYLFTGVGASLMSLWWHRDENLVSAGASGAIFGMFGLFLALLLTDLIPKQMRTAMLQSTAVFVGYNLIYGLKGGVDNSAHIGGLISGFLVGLMLYWFLLKKEKDQQSRIKPFFTVLLILLTAIFIWSGVKLIQPDGNYTSQSSVEKYQEAVTRYAQLEEEAVKVYEQSNSLTQEKYLQLLQETVIPNWKEAEQLFEGLMKENLHSKLLEFVKAMIEYTHLQQQKADITVRLFKTTTPLAHENLNKDLNNTEDYIDSVSVRLQKISEELEALTK